MRLAETLHGRPDGCRCIVRLLDAKQFNRRDGRQEPLEQRKLAPGGGRSIRADQVAAVRSAAADDQQGGVQIKGQPAGGVADDPTAPFAAPGWRDDQQIVTVRVHLVVERFDQVAETFIKRDPPAVGCAAHEHVAFGDVPDGNIRRRRQGPAGSQNLHGIGQGPQASRQGCPLGQLQCNPHRRRLFGRMGTRADRDHRQFGIQAFGQFSRELQRANSRTLAIGVCEQFDHAPPLPLPIAVPPPCPAMPRGCTPGPKISQFPFFRSGHS